MIFIKKRGHIIRLSETKVLRSPCKINTDNIDIESLLFRLRKDGIDLEKDIEYSNDFIFPKIIQDKKPKLSEQIKEKESNEDLNKKLDLILNELMKLKSKETVIYKTENEKKKDIDEDFDEYIPNIDISDLKLDGGEIESTSYKSENVDSNISALKKILGKK